MSSIDDYPIRRLEIKESTQKYNHHASLGSYSPFTAPLRTFKTPNSLEEVTSSISSDGRFTLIYFSPDYGYSAFINRMINEISEISWCKYSPSNTELLDFSISAFGDEYIMYDRVMGEAYVGNTLGKLPVLHDLLSRFIMDFDPAAFLVESIINCMNYHMSITLPSIEYPLY